ncbi:MAG: hypothetical protein AAF433_05325 [Bacteroidota bacterium]
MDLSKRVDSFEIKLRQLASKIDRQRAENVALARENDELKSELDRQRGVVSSLKEKLTRAQQAAGISSTTEDVAGQPAISSAESGTEEIREQLDYCLREIDKCIQWLQQQ